MDITEVKIASKKKLYLFVAIDRVCKYAYLEVYENQEALSAQKFLENLIRAVPFKIHKILTDNGVQFTYALLAEHRRLKKKVHLFDQTCKKNGIKHRLTKFRHPWTNAQVEIFNKKIKEHTTKKYYYETVKEFKEHLMSFLLVYNHQKKLRILQYQSPYEKIIECFEKEPDLFSENPNHKIMGLNTYRVTYSRDVEASWIKKAKKPPLYGYGVYTTTDADGFVEGIAVRPAGESEQTNFSKVTLGLIQTDGRKKVRLLYDKGSDSAANRKALKDKGIGEGIMRRKPKAKKFSYWNKRRNKIISSLRFVIERTFGTIKRVYGLSRAKLIGIPKVTSEGFAKSVAYNLRRASNLMELPAHAR